MAVTWNYSADRRFGRAVAGSARRRSVRLYRVLDETGEGVHVVEADDARHEVVARCAQPPVQVLGLKRRAVAGGSGDQQVPARPEAAPDLGDEGRGMREVLYDEDREDTSERRVREEERGALTSCTSNVTPALPRAARVRATSTMHGAPSTPPTS